ncbi:MAG: AAA family ATPase [Lachnospiraceae bacterium]|nr:AAA family ATPase [Lachnospiraceae bacterium]
MNAFRFEQILEQADEVCNYLDNYTRRGSLGLGMPLSERFRYELLLFAVYLADADGLIETAEVMYIRKVLMVDSVVGDLHNLKKREQIPHKYRLEIPEPLKIAVNVDKRPELQTPYEHQCSQILLDVMTLFGQEFLLLHKNDPSDQTALYFNSYINGLKDYLDHFGLLYSGDKKKFPIKELEEYIRMGVITSAPVAGAYPPEPKPASVSSMVESVEKEKKKEPAPEEDAPSLNECVDELMELIGLEPVKNEVQSLINLLRVQRMRQKKGLKNPDTSRHMVFLGNPGTGKTTVARIVAKIYHALGFLERGHLVECDRSGLVKGYVGQTAIRVKEVVEEARGGVLFIDEAYALTVGCGENDYGQEAVSTLLKAMEDYRSELVVIVAGYPDEMDEFLSSNPGLRSRFNRFLNFKDYSPGEQFEILEFMCKKQDYELASEDKDRIRSYLERRMANAPVNFANARDIRNLLENAIMRQASRVISLYAPTTEDLLRLTAEDFGIRPEKPQPEDS